MEDAEPDGAKGYLCKAMTEYPLYDVPYLVRDPNDFRMSKKRHEIEKRNQAVVDDYFVARDKGLSAREARRLVEEKHHLRPERFHNIFVCFYREARKRRKYDFLEKFFTPDGTLK